MVGVMWIGRQQSKAGDEAECAGGAQSAPRRRLGGYHEK